MAIVMIEIIFVKSATTSTRRYIGHKFLWCQPEALLALLLHALVTRVKLEELQGEYNTHTSIHNKIWCQWKKLIKNIFNETKCTLIIILNQQ